MGQFLPALLAFSGSKFCLVELPTAVSKSTVSHLFQEEPIASFAVLLAIILTVPPIFERLRLPGVLGLLMMGVVVGPNSLGLLSSTSPFVALLADVGLLYLMFVAGLEIDLEQLRKVKNRAAGFGFLTFTLPLIAGTVVGRLFGFDWNGSVLVGSLLASHSLMTYPIVQRLGVVANEAVTVTIGATICTDIGALVVLAICLGINEGGFSLQRLLTLLSLLTIYTLVVLFGLSWAGRAFFRRSGNDEGNQFLFVLLAVFLSALGAELIGVEKIVGAFLSGLAVNGVLRDGPVKEKVVFVGSVLFIPMFFVNVGLLINLPAFVSSLVALWLALAIVVALVASKFLAALLAKLKFRYSWREMLTMGSMSIPQVATTLAATLVGNRAGMLSDELLNGVVMMMLVTATLGPLLVSRTAVGLPVPQTVNADESWLMAVGEQRDSAASSIGNFTAPFTVMVPVYNPQTEQFLIELSALLAQQQGGQIVPLAITVARSHMTRSQLENAAAKSEILLEKASEFSQTYAVKVNPLLRIDENIASGICRASQEKKASLIVMGWGGHNRLSARLFGTIVDSVFWKAPCLVAVARLMLAPSQIRRILVPVEAFSDRSARTVAFVHRLAEAIRAEVTLLHVLSRSPLADTPQHIEQQMKDLITQTPFASPVQSIVVKEDDVSKAILVESEAFDLMVLNAQPHRWAAEGFGFSSITSQLVKQMRRSTIVLSESHLR
ncbi:MAG: cation:proton antiporter [Phormidesmis sp.]